MERGGVEVESRGGGREPCLLVILFQMLLPGTVILL